MEDIFIDKSEALPEIFDKPLYAKDGSHADTIKRQPADFEIAKDRDKRTKSARSRKNWGE